MPLTTESDGSEDVNDFLQRIRELGDQRGKEDEERTRKLEEEIIQGRKERQARRAERARSLSPAKDAPTHSDPPGLVQSYNDSSIPEDPSKDLSLSRPSGTPSADMDEAPQKINDTVPMSMAQGNPVPSRELLQPPVKPQHIAGVSPSVAMAPSRSNTLSWQQRPSSRGSTTGSVRSRPLLTMTSEKNASKSSRLPLTAALEIDDGVSRSLIAQSLGTKDLAFFKQTQDRGSGSAAYRRSQVEDLSDATSMSGSMRLPGMSSESTVEPEPRMSSPSQSSRTTAPSREGSIRGSTGLSEHYQNSVSTSSLGGFHSPLLISNSQRFEPHPSEPTSFLGSSDASSIGRTMAMSPSQGRISPERTERPASPTKGLGGFVQSAMMKRSDSVNKRWSAQAGPGLSRGNSVASNRGGLNGVRFPLGSHETTPLINSRPTSSHNDKAVNKPSVEDRMSSAELLTRNKHSEAPSTTAGPTVSSPEKTSTTPPRPLSPSKDGLMMSPPSSPSKRWSPTKSSWLENAISKPEPPKILSPAASQRPAWMADLNRNRQQQGSVDLGKGPAFKEVATGGLARSPPPGTGCKPPTISGLPGGFSSGVAVKPKTSSSDDIRGSGSPEFMRQNDKLSGSSTALNLSRGAETPPSPLTSLKAPERDLSNVGLKAKPKTPPKKDFRTTLKPRQTSGESKGKDEPEFKNVFGKLKKTQTQNYVAPDELKNNIMRGKTGLAKTDGPQKSKTKDEFKESILKKKEGMVTPSASTRITSASSKNPDASTPEAIARRQGLGRSNSAMSNNNVEERKPAPKPEALAQLQILQEKPNIVVPKKQDSAPTAIQQAPEKPKPGFGGGFASSLAGILQKGPSPMAGAAKPPPALQDDRAPIKSVAARARPGPELQSCPELTHATKGRARGPKRKPPTAVSQEIAASPTIFQLESQLKPIIIENNASMSSPATKREASPESSGLQPLSIITNNNSNIRKTSQPNTPRKPSTGIAKPLSSKPSPVTPQGPIEDEPPPKASPVVAQKPTQSPTILKVNKPAISTLQKSYDQPPGPNPPANVPQKGEAAPIMEQREEEAPPQPLPSVKNLAGIWGQSPRPLQSSQPRSPVEPPMREDEEAAMPDAGLRTKGVIGLGIETPVQAVQISRQEAPSISTKSPKSPPLPGRKPATIDAKSSAAPLPSPPLPKRTTSPFKEPSESTKLFTNIFDEPPTSKTKINVDTQAVLDARPSTDLEKIKTLRKQIFEIADNGKSVPVPLHQEHILFEDSLYLCTHVFGTPAGTRTTEVYLWCGDGVSASAIEDAHLFARKTAKEISGKLILLRQGKETSNFFQALGGIVITRKGSSSRSDSAIYMLCGRRHLGQIAFDEVDFDPQSLCRGFPYIVSARGGRLFLWYGHGAGADELGCARLIGMDLGLTGEIEEIEEGKEPSDFWSSFPTGTSNPTAMPSSTKHWQLKPSYEKYTTKLFEVDVETPRPKSSSGFMSWGRGSAPTNEAGAAMEAKIREVIPFSQADLVDEGIFVLDTFFEIFVILPLRTSLNPAPQHRSTKSSCLRAALLFAQDYGILAASAEDRPFVPHSSVVIMSKLGGGPKGIGGGEIPEGMKRCFRKWDSTRFGGGNFKVLSLTEALASEES